MFMYVLYVFLLSFRLNPSMEPPKLEQRDERNLRLDPSLLDMLTSDKIDPLLSKSIMSDK